MNVEEDYQLRLEYEDLPKTRWHGQSTTMRHPDIRPEWIMRIVKDPYDRWEEIAPDGELRTLLVGRVPQFEQWIKVVFIGDLSTGSLHTAYADRRLGREYGGQP